MTDKKFKFWKFGEDSIEMLNPLEGIDFGNQELLSSDDMKINNERLKARVDRYKDKPCYGFLKGFYEFYEQVNNAKDDNTIITGFHNAETSLHLFALCYEKEFAKPLV
jgi:hypothetical protein